jgi:hypothetical protein
MNLSELLGFKKEEKIIPSIKGGQGKKKCRNCSEYIGVRSKNCKYCKYDFTIDRQQELPLAIEPIYVYEHLRTDTWEAEQANRILEKKNFSEEKEFIYVPSGWRPLCYSIDELLERKNKDNISLRNDRDKIIVKCIPTNNFQLHENPRLGKLQELIVVEVIND